MKLIALSIFCLCVFILIYVDGLRSGRKNKTPDQLLHDLDRKIKDSLLSDLNYRTLRAMIDEYRKRGDMNQVALDVLEKQFQHKFVEFGGRVVYPDLEKFAQIERTYSADLCCGIYEEPKEVKFENRNDQFEEDMHFMSHMQ